MTNGVTDVAGGAYPAPHVAPGVAAPDPEELLEFRWVPFVEVMAMIERGEISDALTVLPLQALALERARGGAV